ncbi:hypothetical protein FHS61_001039 [Altererythrobacter atlanticus]|uniref:Uncharacterized protein n=1 Tax=Croceibacterium atlanticum TaxID=1267766 RepID=A0A0F7KUG3_9SPHN|nr:DUF6152 family protein [Croceibacterium atlanticum]AKH43259.1 hypothetical protein WYH_02227 [Croceibacterium atlanticum]MBB5732035.1 hypothetical protein [Croceibacterium atlanticum]
MIVRKTRLALAAAALAGLAAVATPGSAHHSTAMFEWGTSTAMKNVTVERWEWTNPHTFIYVRDADGKRWAFEGMSPNHLSRAGWSKRSLKPGDKIDLTYYKLRDGRRGGFNVTVTKTDGTQLTQLPGQE